MKWDLLGTAAVTLALAAGAAQDARATPYAYSTTQFSQFSINGTAVSPTTFKNGSVATSSTATYTGYATVSGTGGAAKTVTLTSNPGSDVTEAYTGPGSKPGDDVYTQQLLANPGTRGDAVVGTANPFTPFSSSTEGASDVAEGMIAEVPASIDAGATGTQSEALKFNLTGVEGTSITFKFKASNEVYASTTLPGDFSKSTTENSIIIKEDVGGVLTNPAGGGNIYQPASLNLQAECELLSAPCIDSSTNSRTGTYTFTYAFTASATYQISLNSTSVVQLDSAPVPEPASLVLLGTALLGVGGVVRRRRKS